MSDLPPQDLVERLRGYGQEHLLRWWDELEAGQQKELLAQLQSVDFERVHALTQAALLAGRLDPAGVDPDRLQPPSRLIGLPATDDDQKEWECAEACGRELLAAGKVGAILVAGGQGTRLGFPHPKGMYPIGPVSGCSLFQLLAEQLLARSKRAGAAIPYYVMTSDATHDETVDFFAGHADFGLAGDDLRFFRQGNMPAVDCQTGKLLLEEKGGLSTSPDGHGGLLAALERAGLLDDMRRRGVEFLYYHQVDNPTVIVCDPAFLGFHALRQSEMSTKVVCKRSADEKMGVVVDVDGKTQIIEYTDLPTELAQKRDESGQLRFWAGNTAMHVFSRALLERLLADGTPLPFHLAHKVVPFLDETGRAVKPDSPNAWKFERFIFDALPLAQRPLVVEADRGREFNPVKNAEGHDSPATSQGVMSAIYRSWLREAGAVVADDVPVEISPLFALDADELRGKIPPGVEFTTPVWLRN